METKKAANAAQKTAKRTAKEAAAMEEEFARFSLAEDGDGAESSWDSSISSGCL